MHIQGTGLYDCHLSRLGAALLSTAFPLKGRGSPRAAIPPNRNYAGGSNLLLMIWYLTKKSCKINIKVFEIAKKESLAAQI